MTNSPHGTALQATVLLIAAWIMLGVTASSCSRQTADKPVLQESSEAATDPGFPVPEAGNLVLILGHDGRLEPMSGMDKSQTQGPQPAPFALQPAVAAVLALMDGGAVVAINRTGLVYLGIKNRHVILRRMDGADAEFTDRSVAQAWTWNGKAMFLLHRNEIFETGAVRVPAARVIVAEAEGARALPGFGPLTGTTEQDDTDLYGSPYALFPRTPDSWLVQFRLAGQDRTRTAFAVWDPVQQRMDLLDRSTYETAARPAPVAGAPETLRLAMEALGGSLIVDAGMPDGSRMTWRQGNPDTFRAARALVSDTSAISLAADGHLVMADAKGVHGVHLDPPVPQAYFRDLAVLDGFIIAVWEEDLFPNLGRSGLVIMDTALYRDRTSPTSEL